MEHIGEDPSKLFRVVRLYADVNRDIEAVFKRYGLNDEEKLLVLSIIAEEYMKEQEKNVRKL